MKVQYGEEVANHSGPESCGMDREVHVEALTGETDRPAIEPRNSSSGMPTLLSEAEGNMAHDDNRKSCADPARSETLSMSGSLSYGSSEISSVSGWIASTTMTACATTMMSGALTHQNCNFR
jgi:RNA-directed DNA polymerase